MWPYKRKTEAPDPTTVSLLSGEWLVEDVIQEMQGRCVIVSLQSVRTGAGIRILVSRRHTDYDAIWQLNRGEIVAFRSASPGKPFGPGFDMSRLRLSRTAAISA